MDPNRKEKSIKECINSLEILFNYYKDDNEFNYQLSCKDSAFNTLKRKLNEYLIREK